jgi:DMSO/TMAO reductase YedYZ heme-binding membrane subunit
LSRPLRHALLAVACIGSTVVVAVSTGPPPAVTERLSLLTAWWCWLLLALSNNRALRRLGAERWKRWQRKAVWVFALTAAHGVVFQFVEARLWPWLPGLVFLAVAVLALRRRASAAVERR